MAAATLSTVITENFGTNTLYKATFTNIDTTNTYTVTPMTNVVAYWCSPTDIPSTITKTGIDVSYAQTTGIFTFSTSEAGRTGDLYILAKT